MADTMIETVLDGDYASLKENLEHVVAKRLHDRVQAKKVEVLAEINGLTKGQMKEAMGGK